MYGARTTRDLDVDLAYNGSCFVGGVLTVAAGTRVAKAWDLAIICGKNGYQSWEDVQILASNQSAIFVSFLFGLKASCSKTNVPALGQITSQKFLK